jgi:AbrB family looped-hinge helix DNA binding protein
MRYYVKRRYNTKITRKGQITVPAELRRNMKLGIGDSVSLVEEDGEVRLERTGSWVERTAGIFYRPGMPILSDRELKDAAEQAWADEAFERDERSKRR